MCRKIEMKLWVLYRSQIWIGYRFYGNSSQISLAQTMNFCQNSVCIFKLLLNLQTRSPLLIQKFDFRFFRLTNSQFLNFRFYFEGKSRPLSSFERRKSRTTLKMEKKSKNWKKNKNKEEVEKSTFNWCRIGFDFFL